MVGLSRPFSKDQKHPLAPGQRYLPRRPPAGRAALISVRPNARDARSACCCQGPSGIPSQPSRERRRPSRAICRSQGRRCAAEPSSRMSARCTLVRRRSATAVRAGLSPRRAAPARARQPVALDSLDLRERLAAGKVSAQRRGVGPRISRPRRARSAAAVARSVRPKPRPKPGPGPAPSGRPPALIRCLMRSACCCVRRPSLTAWSSWSAAALSSADLSRSASRSGAGRRL